MKFNAIMSFGDLMTVISVLCGFLYIKIERDNDRVDSISNEIEEIKYILEDLIQESKDGFPNICNEYYEIEKLRYSIDFANNYNKYDAIENLINYIDGTFAKVFNDLRNIKIKVNRCKFREGEQKDLMTIINTINSMICDLKSQVKVIRNTLAEELVLIDEEDVGDIEVSYKVVKLLKEVAFTDDKEVNYEVIDLLYNRIVENFTSLENKIKVKCFFS
jgi:hypothetical protein